MELKITWRGLNEGLASKTETEVQELLDYECVTERRASVILRLHQRLNTLRINRERAELLKLAERG